MVKNLATMQEMLVRSLRWKDHLEEEMATHSSVNLMDRGWSLVHGVAKSWTRLSD